MSVIFSRKLICKYCECRDENGFCSLLGIYVPDGGHCLSKKKGDNDGEERQTKA